MCRGLALTAGSVFGFGLSVDIALVLHSSPKVAEHCKSGGGVQAHPVQVEGPAG